MLQITDPASLRILHHVTSQECRDIQATLAERLTLMNAFGAGNVLPTRGGTPRMMCEAARMNSEQHKRDMARWVELKKLLIKLENALETAP